MHSNTRQALRVDAFGLRERVLGKSRQAHQRTIMHSNTRTLKHEMVDLLGKSRQDNHALEHKSRQAHQRTITHSNTRTLEDEMVLGKSRQDNHALEHSTG